MSIRLFLLLPLTIAFPTRGIDSAKELWAKGTKFSEEGHYAEGRSLYEQIVKRFPESPEAALAKERTGECALLRVKPLEVTGPSERRIDIFVIGEGYTLDSQDNFDNAAKNTARIFLQNRVFKEYRNYFNIWQMNLLSKDDGVDYEKRQYETALDGKQSGFKQGQVTVDHGRVHHYLRQAPQSEGLAIVIVKRGVLGTGGGGVAIVGGGPNNTVIHEFGHAFGHLLDEYADDVGYGGRASVAANVTDNPDPKLVPWKHWLDAGAKGIGVYEGAEGRLKGAYKSNTGGCVMEHGSEYCVVCREQIVLQIARRLGPLESCQPEESNLTLPRKGKRDLTVRFLAPAGHPLTIEWYVEPVVNTGGGGLPAPGPASRSTQSGGRNHREWKAIPGKPQSGRVDAAKGIATFTVAGEKLSPGIYRAVARVVDPTPLDGLPWVLADPGHLLEDRAEWWVEVQQAR